ncbi:hypothetical protein [Salipiger mucosus]|uniref:Methyl-accepting chemotaxis protein n=1 Tax=Salipiger mucosus DSM 16094 TaxID=1123237 RepID=S9R0C7_9RHOB|nr:hypothetical protein [Salipiger mucosus]EPX85388.1 Methyl-accepting chemotaxis protein [Salipiger mucosus DSM 16094]
MDEERLIVALEARIRDFEKNMQKAERRGTQSYQRLRSGSRMATSAMERDMLRSTSRINQALATTSTRIGAVGKAFAVGAITAGFAAIARGATAAVRSMAEIDSQARQAGLSVTAFQELTFVSEQNRIGVDAMVDGLKELQLRADEFIVTGKGAGAEAFQRLGYGAEDLARRLEEPEQLFLDIIGRMEDLDRAAQIRVADEVFGGTGGERFVELLRQGKSGIREMMDRAHDLGAVIEEDTVSKAAELDRKFAEITRRVSTLAKTVVVDLAGAIEDVVTMDVDEIFGSAERAIAMMGEENYRAMKDGAQATEEQRETVEDLANTYDELFRAINAATGPDGIRLMDVADLPAAHELAGILQDIEREMQAFKTGSSNAGEFEEAVTDLVGEAQDLIAELSAVDAQRFGNVVSAIGGIADALVTAANNAATLRQNLPAGDDGAISYGPQNGRRPSVDLRPGENAPETSVRPRLPSVNFGFGGSSGSSGGSSGGGGGGGGRSVDDYRREVERTREAVARLEAEAVALAAVAETGFEYGDAVDYARKKAELLYEAQAAGKEVTPELRAEIDELAQAYARAGQAADDASDKLDRIEENTERGADAMTDLFTSILDGSKTAGEALRDLLMQIIEIQLQQRMMGLATSGGGGFFQAIGGLLGGARAGGGPVRAGVPYLINERTPQSEMFVPSESGGVLNVPQAQAALSQRATKSEGSLDLNLKGAIDVGVDGEGNVKAMVRDMGVTATRQGATLAVNQMKTELPGWMQRLKTHGAL